jgi:hypothetical protein
MASVEGRRRSDGAMRWHVRYRTPDGKQKGKTFLRKVDATRYLIEVESTKEAGNYIDPKRSKLTTGEWARKWLEMQTHLKPSTLARYDGIVSKHIEPAWGTTLLRGSATPTSGSGSSGSTWPRRRSATSTACSR